MKKLYVHTLAYNSLKFVEESIARFESQIGFHPIELKVLVDPSYPITGGKTQDEYSECLRAIAEKYSWAYLKMPQNLGVGKNWSWVVEQLNLSDDSIVYGNDPDSRPVQKGYLDAIMRVFSADPSCYTVQLNVAGTYIMGLPREEFVMGGEYVVAYRQPCAFTVGAFSVEWLRKAGGMLQGHPLYGFLETAMDAKIKPMGGRFLILRDFYDAHLKAEDQEYTQWKLECAQFKTMLPFDQWLKDKK